MSQTQKIATVFGGTGFIGRHVVRDLARLGYTIKVATRVPERAFFLRMAGMVGQIVPFACHYKDPASIALAVRGADIVVNCVGILHERRKGDFQRVHAELPGTIASICAQENVKRFIHISVPGLGQDRSRYATTKAEGERAIFAACPGAIILRPSLVFGADDNFFNKFAKLIQLMPVLPLIGGGQTKFQPVFAGDVAEAVAVCVQNPATQGHVFELAGPETVAFKDIYEILFRYTGRRRPLINLPWGVAKFQASLMSLLPNPLLTPDQVESLKTDYVIAPDALTFKDLGIVPKGMDLILPTYLERYRAGGRFANSHAA